MYSEDTFRQGFHENSSYTYRYVNIFFWKVCKYKLGDDKFSGQKISCENVWGWTLSISFKKLFVMRTGYQNMNVKKVGKYSLWDKIKRNYSKNNRFVFRLNLSCIWKKTKFGRSQKLVYIKQETHLLNSVFLSKTQTYLEWVIYLKF